MALVKLNLAGGRQVPVYRQDMPDVHDVGLGDPHERMGQDILQLIEAEPDAEGIAPGMGIYTVLICFKKQNIFQRKIVLGIFLEECQPGHIRVFFRDPFLDIENVVVDLPASDNYFILLKIIRYFNPYLHLLTSPLQAL